MKEMVINMNVMLTSCGLETKAIEARFLKMLKKSPEEAKAIFIPTAANSAGAIEVLPKCLNDLLKCGIKSENIFVYDLYDSLTEEFLKQYDIIYLCGGSPEYLLRRINESGFDKCLNAFIEWGGLVIGVSAGSIIFAENLPNHLNLLPCVLDVHCEKEQCEKPGEYGINEKKRIRLGNEQAILFENNKLVIME